MVIMRICVLLVCIIANHALNGQDFYIPISKHEANNALLCAHTRFMEPVRFTKQGLQHFITHVYNVPEYGTDFLPNNLYHIALFLRRYTAQPLNYCQSVLRMFGNKLKQTLYINPYAFSELLDEITPLLNKLITSHKTSTLARLQQEMSETMSNHMLHKFDHLKADPSAYFTELSHNIMQLINKHELSGDSSVDSLRKTLMAFLETTINKLIWTPDEHTHAWDNVKLISSQLHMLLQEDILNDKGDLNALYVSLLERFCLYLDLACSDIPVTFYATLRQEIAHKTATFFHLEEGQFFETKAQRLERAITLAEAKTRAYHEGIIVS